MNLYEINFDNPDSMWDTFMVIVVADSEADAVELAKITMLEEERKEYTFRNVVEHDLTKPVVYFTGI